MHPTLSLWIWSMALLRDWNLLWSTNPKNQCTNVKQVEAAPAVFYGTNNSAVDWSLPANILDRLSELHWMERDPSVGV
jgi:hypothetical protein